MAICRHFGPCGGCQWQDLSYADQLARKHRRLTDLFRTSLGRGAPPIDALIGVTPDHTGWPWAFRHKAAFVFGGSPDGSLTLGHYAARSRTVVPIVECPVHTSRANHIAFSLHRRLLSAGLTATAVGPRGVLRHVIVRTTRDGREAAAMLVVSRNDHALRAPIRAFLATDDAPGAFYLNVNEAPGPGMIGHETRRLAGRSHVRETVADVSYLVSPTTFFQTNVDAAEHLVRLVLQAVPDQPPRRILDLYSGCGLFTLPLALRGHRVTGVEENPQAVEDAEASVRLNRIPADRVHLRAGRVERELRRLRAGGYDVVILDPPRKGSSLVMRREVFGRLRPSHALYVSCNAEALVSELPSILAEGYQVHRVQPVDMFPHTPHVEVLVALKRRDGPMRARSRERRTVESPPQSTAGDRTLPAIDPPCVPGALSGPFAAPD
ncbi:MAG: 23S rRNA (uracil(1939)-C(5))-methyltransferase RlmD [Acidobacteriota bacterium]